MNKIHIHCETGHECDFRPARQFRTGISLHGHTLHSKESLNFIYPLAKKILPFRIALQRGQARYKHYHGADLDLNRGWWTPPLAAHAAWSVETRQIQERFDLQSLVSLSDHDNIEAPLTLRILDECRTTPISVEWTVPYRETFFHIGVHNISGENARPIMARLAKFTAGGSEEPLMELFMDLTDDQGTLIVFNHPNWDESGVGALTHRALAREFGVIYGSFLHAFELNGLRPWNENRSNLELARDFGKPVISGGDRHGIEPNTILNLTNAATFSEFVAEVREGYSEVFITKQYLEPFSTRILQNFEDVLSDQPGHALGWTRWCDRAFFICDDGVTRSLSEAWGEGPLGIRLFTQGLAFLRHPQFKNAFRFAFARREEVAL